MGSTPRPWTHHWSAPPRPTGYLLNLPEVKLHGTKVDAPYRAGNRPVLDGRSVRYPTPWTEVSFDKLVVVQSVKKFHAS